MLKAADDERTAVSRYADFLLDEAELIDQRRLDEWTSLFADDAVYWMPMDQDQAAPGDGLNIIYDDRPRLLDRVSRLNSGLAFADEPHSATSHTLSPVRLLEGQRALDAAGGRELRGGERALAARCVIGRARQGRTETFHARVRWVLRDSGDSLLIVMKRIDLLNAQDPLPVLTLIL
jgi:3-phenylpropionate/cinnamic acid dioxygenase small subunit